jgi:hypothetical protein
MPVRIDLSSRHAVFRMLWDFTVGAGTATSLVLLLLLLLREGARRGVSSAIFRYVGF